MPSNPKKFAREIKRKSKIKSQTVTVQVPSTCDEYLAGVDFEEAGEKWRGGDAEKSARAFTRAIVCYNEGLQKFPSSFDLAYNKARTQYELTQHPKLMRQLPDTTLELLNKALASSKYALGLQPEIPDILFNTAQVLSSIAEELDGSIQTGYSNPSLLLEEALSLFHRCLELQEASAHDQKLSCFGSNSSSDLDSEDGGVPIATAEGLDLQDDRWASIIEPITDETLLDTVLATIETLTTLSQMMSPNDVQGLNTIEKYANDISSKLETYLTNKARVAEAYIIRSNFICAFNTAKYRSSLIDEPTYTRTIENAYVGIELSTNPEGLCACAESFVTYSNALRLHADADTYHLELRWKALTKALEYLTSASKISRVQNVEKIHLARGDVELSRFQLGQTGLGLRVSQSNSSTLLKNAEKYYRGSEILMRNISEQILVTEANLKEALVLALGGDTTRLRQVESSHQNLSIILDEAIEEGLITSAQLKNMGIKI
ncbi:hypothetical protein K3495_g2445 [Podosphaera aphanis]|nr:hypothetical protein K3495_g2445 [Podosphaera aphanis]